MVEWRLANKPTGLFVQKIDYDIAYYNLYAECHRFIEVKGRAKSPQFIVITSQATIIFLRELESFILAIVEVGSGLQMSYDYVKDTLDMCEPPFDGDSTQFNLKRRLECAELPG